MKRVISTIVCLIALSLMPAMTHAADATSIHWHRQLGTGCQQAINQKLPLVVVLIGNEQAPDSSVSRKMRQEVLNGPEFGGYSNRAVFVELVAGQNDLDANAVQLKKVLEIKTTPVVIVMKAEPNRIHAIGKVVGYDGAQDFLNEFSGLFAKATGTAPVVHLVSKPASHEFVAPPAAPAAAPIVSKADQQKVAELVQKLNTESKRTSEAEIRFTQLLTGLSKNESFDNRKLQETYHAVAKQFAVLHSLVDDLEQIPGDEVRQFAAQIRNIMLEPESDYFRSYMEVTRAMTSTRLKGELVSPEIAKIAGRNVMVVSNRVTSAEYKVLAANLEAAGRKLAEKYWPKPATGTNSVPTTASR